MAEVPFIYGRLAEIEEFTNRRSEMVQLRRNFEAGINTILISPRRWGKSSLVAHAAGKIEGRKLKVCLLDLYNTRSEAEFYEQFSKAVLTAVGGKLSDITAYVREFLSKFIPRINISTDPNSDISLSLDWNEVQKDPAEILQLAEKICARKKIKMVVCIDEFQQVAGFENPLSFQKKLRAAWQKQRHVSYCLYGSKRHMMMDVFTKNSMPFYKFGDLMFLEKISTDDWQRFIVKRFTETGKQITETLAAQIAEHTVNHSYYTQQLAQQVWLRTTKKCTASVVSEAHESLCNQLSMLFQMMTDALPTTQVNYLKALLAGETQLSAKNSIDTYHLGSSAHVVRIRQALLEKEILDDAGNGLEFIDPYFAYWLKTRYFGSFK